VIPFSRFAGFDRGQPIDRYYIEKFLAGSRLDIRGRVLEIGDDRYTVQFGGGRVTRGDVLHVAAGNPKATIVADLTCADAIAAETFDCIVMTQTLQMIYDARAAARHLHRILKPGGVLLLTTAGISQVSGHEGVGEWGEYWHLTSQAARRLFGEVFGAENVAVGAHGNVLAATALLYGLASKEVRGEELDFQDPDYEVLVTVRAVKAG
jgi:SAM-dependent methyltransferase